MSLLVVAGLVLFPASFAQATMGQHPDAEVPGSHQAAFFSPIVGQFATGDGALAAAQRAVADHHHNITEFYDATGGTNDHPDKATAENFLKLSGRGVVVIFTHASPGSMLVEAYATEGVRDHNLETYLKGSDVPKKPPLFRADELVKCSFSVVGFGGSTSPAVGICLTTVGIQRHFKDRNTIVYFVGCSSFSLVDAFNAREYFGYEGVLNVCPVTGPLARDAEILWGRMHGKVDDGKHRAARVAFGAGGYSQQFRYKHKSDKIDTVLSPAVREIKPDKNESFTVPTTVKGLVSFDAKMDTSIPPGKVINVRDQGCLPRIRNPRWASDFTLEFDLDLRLQGKARLVVEAGKALGRRQGKEQQLDGNNFGAGPDHIGPNGDNFEWEINCKPTSTPTSTSTPGTMSVRLQPTEWAPSPRIGSS
jgi:hypothetical protein